MKKNKSAIIIVIVIVIVLIVLFALPRINNPDRETVKSWKENDVNCLPSHTNAAQHIHPELRIVVDGRDETLPVNTGIVRSCMAEIHIHDASGTIHVESVLASKTFTLNQFFNVWGKTLEREGFTLEMTVDDVPNSEFDNLVFRDKQKIELKYTKING